MHIVVNDSWNVSTVFPVYDAQHNVLPGVQLSVFNVRHGWSHMMKGWGDGRVFETREGANRWCLDHGYLEAYYRGVWCLKHRMQHWLMGSRVPSNGECAITDPENTTRAHGELIWC